MECGECKLCCTLFDIFWMNSPPGEHCKHECSIGCKIYKTRPEDCKEFSCAYNQMEKVSIKMRPDISGVIFERITNDIFWGTVDIKLVYFSDDLNNQIDKFVKDGFSVILVKKDINGPIIYPTNNKNPDDIWKEAEKIREKVNGNTSIYN